VQEQIQQRLTQLKAEFEEGQKMLADLERPSKPTCEARSCASATQSRCWRSCWFKADSMTGAFAAPKKRG
jgi:hypothetical protein